MQNIVLTLTDHILTERKKTKHDLTILLHQIENVSKIVASHVKASGLVDILGKTGRKNAFGEEVQKLDEFSNNLLIHALLAGGQVQAVISEENKEPIFASKENEGEYVVFFDPLDGSSNIDTICPIGTIFGIYHKDGGILQPGENQIAAGYIIYGSSVMFVYTVGNGVNGFTLDPAIGNYLLSHPNITIPEDSNLYSINEAYEHKFDKELLSYLQKLKQKENTSLRYVGSMVADMHRTLIKGGIFLYPTINTYPKGKLRLTIEVNPFAYITEQAGGKVVGIKETNPLTIVPKHIHDRSPIIAGSKKMIEEYLAFYK
ncbi:MAG TPA: class 1 fructose-bisphosphatase [Candidatus Sulfotelmatobacter sp.]|jgi:fructose-1,6-bisphosphatase I|nr:class 1 fructose-bisphosphatase [Candidatus Sulfotelmatobacter sp.]